MMFRGEKRKENTTSTSDGDIIAQIKRFKINCTPGELRLQKDLKEMKNIEGVTIELTDRPSTIIIKFKDRALDSNNVDNKMEFMNILDHESNHPYVHFIPNNFAVTVPHYYPHFPPSIQVIDILTSLPVSTSSSSTVISQNKDCSNHNCNYYSSHYILQNGTINHPNICENWSAIGSLWNVIDTLQSIRDQAYIANSRSHSPIPDTSRENSFNISNHQQSKQTDGNDKTMNKLGKEMYSPNHCMMEMDYYTNERSYSNKHHGNNSNNSNMNNASLNESMFSRTDQTSSLISCQHPGVDPHPWEESYGDGIGFDHRVYDYDPGLSTQKSDVTRAFGASVGSGSHTAERSLPSCHSQLSLLTQEFRYLSEIEVEHDNFIASDNKSSVTLLHYSNT